MTHHNKEDWKNYLQLGLEIALPVLFFFFAGYFLDKYFQTKPYLTLTGIVISICGVFYNIWKKFLR